MTQYRLLSTHKETKEQMVGQKTTDFDNLEKLAKKFKKEYDCEIVRVEKTFK